MVSHELVATCADAVLRASDGLDIPCSLFTCLAACSVIRHLHEGVTLDTTPCGKTVIPVPGVPSATLVRIVDVIHGVTLIRDLCLKDIVPVFDGVAVLGCETLEDALMDRLWHLVSEARSMKLLRAHADRLLRHPDYRMPAVRMALRLAPQWKAFRAAFLDSVEMNVGVALFLGKVLVTFYPPPVVVRAIVDALPPASATQDTVLRLAGLRDAGACYHPAETEDLLDMLANEFRGNRWDPVLRDVFCTLLDAHRVYTVAPVSAATLFGSEIRYDGARCTSVFVRCPPDIRRMRRVAWLTPWLRTEIDHTDGAMSMRIHTWRLHVMPPSTPARGFQLRVFLVADDVVEDVWYVWDRVSFPAGATLDLTNVSRIVGDPQDLCRAIRRAATGEGNVKSLRFDLFYEAYSALDEPTLV